ncbi:MAG: RluA family pseudouridine synthase [Thermodesulfobacteriota bacterium]
MAEPILYLSVAEDLDNKRLDSYLAGLEELAHLSRSRIQDLINSGQILVNDQPRKKGYLVRRNDRIAISFPPPKDIIPKAENIPLDIVYEDEDIIVLAKAAGLVVHPAGGHEKGTLVNGLLYHSSSFKDFSGDPLRPGIVHRLDKDTSGVMVVAKNDSSRQELIRQFKNRKVEKVYHAVLSGVPEKKGTVRKDLGRHPVHRKKRAILAKGGKEAVTHWQVLEVLGRFSFVRLQLDTGRTHQIRVHLAFLHCPVAGDPLYGRKERLPNLKSPRLCLHASNLTFNHPSRGHRISFTAPLPADLRKFLEILRHNNS